MRTVGLIATLVVLAVCGTAMAQYSAPWLGRGGAGTAITNEDATGFVNPAALSQIDTAAQANDPEDKWVGQIGYSHDLIAGADYWVLQGAARRAGDNYGWGAGLGQLGDEDTKDFYISYGKQFCAKEDGSGWAWGLTLGDMREQRTVSPVTTQLPTPRTDNVDKIIVNAGLLYNDTTSWFGGGKWSFGVVAADALDNMQTIYNTGLGLKVGKLQLAADYVDATDEVDSMFCAGAEYDVCPYLSVRAGSLDGDFTYGASLKYDRLALDYANIDADADTANSIVGSHGTGDFDAISVRYVYSW